MNIGHKTIIRELTRGQAKKEEETCNPQDEKVHGERDEGGGDPEYEGRPFMDQG